MVFQIIYCMCSSIPTSPFLSQGTSVVISRHRTHRVTEILTAIF